MKNKKMSPMEELRAESLKLKEECEEQELMIRDNVSYLRENIGSLLVTSVFSSSTNSIKSMFGFSDDSTDKKKTFFSRFSFFLPMIWEVAQPVLIGIVTKKLTSKLFRFRK